MSLKPIAAVVSALLLAGCTSIQVKPVDASRYRAEHICIQENPKVIIDDFLDVLRTGVERHGLTTEVFRSDRAPSGCEFVLTYSARQSWDFAPYLSVAYLELRGPRGELVSRGDYKLRGKGGFSLMKWQGTAAKMDPVIDQMFASLAPARDTEAARAATQNLLAKRPHEDFHPWHFRTIKPGETTREEIDKLFGPPSSSMNMGVGMLQETWTTGSQVVSIVYLDGVFSHLQALSNVPLSAEERKRLGL